MGVGVLFKLSTGDDVAVHAAIATTAQINMMTNAGNNGLLRAEVVKFVMALMWGSGLVGRFHY